jgi:hypothetical protein
MGILPKTGQQIVWQESLRQSPYLKYKLDKETPPSTNTRIEEVSLTAVGTTNVMVVRRTERDLRTFPMPLISSK